MCRRLSGADFSPDLADGDPGLRREQRRELDQLGLVDRGAGQRRQAGNLPQLGTAASAGHGVLQSGALEMSNVDLAQEFTNLVIAQRGFQANAKVITASDELLQDLVNLKR